MASDSYDLIDDEFWGGNVITKEKLLLWETTSILGHEVYRARIH